jgi:AbrB family looped-hinge helix DNA binding protein
LLNFPINKAYWEWIETGAALMTLVRLRERAQITLPQELRDALKLKQGDYLEAEVVEGKLILKPVAVITRETARQELLEMLSGPSRWKGPSPEPSEDELIEEIVSDIKEERRKRREGGR